LNFLDANVFLRFLVAPRTDADIPKQDASASLFEAIEAGDYEAITSELIVHEVLFNLCSKRQYGFAKPEAVAMVRPLLELGKLHMQRKRLVLDALTLFATYTFLDFPDAMSIVTAQEDGHVIVSYDRGISRVPGAVRVEP